MAREMWLNLLIILCVCVFCIIPLILFKYTSERQDTLHIEPAIPKSIYQSIVSAVEKYKVNNIFPLGPRTLTLGENIEQVYTSVCEISGSAFPKLCDSQVYDWEVTELENGEYLLVKEADEWRYRGSYYNRFEDASYAMYKKKFIYQVNLREHSILALDPMSCQYLDPELYFQKQHGEPILCIHYDFYVP